MGTVGLADIPDKLLIIILESMQQLEPMRSYVTDFEVEVQGKTLHLCRCAVEQEIDRRVKSYSVSD